MPSTRAQAAVIEEALSRAGLDARDVGFLELHGSGTPRGDRIEVEGLGLVFSGRSRAEALPVASVKTNIGRLEAAAGIAGLVRAVLAVSLAELTPS